MNTSTASVTDETTEFEKEFSMTTASVWPGSRRARGIDLVAIRVSIAVLLWAERRASRRAISRDDLARRIASERARTAREHEFASRRPRAL